MRKPNKIVLDIKEKDVDKIFQKRYGNPSWQQLLVTMPDREVDLKDFIELELELQEVKRLIRQVRESEGSMAANIGLSDNSKPCISPLQNLLAKKRGQRLAMRRAHKDILENLSGDEDDRLSALDDDDEDDDE